jgi:hypothetical protein
MVRRLSVAMTAAAVVIVLTASLALGSQAPVRWSEPLEGAVILCPTMTYTAVSGEADYLLHIGQSASGNANLTTTLTFRNAIAEDEDGGRYAVRGAVHYTMTANGGTDGYEETTTETLQIIALQGGGSVGSVNYITHLLVQPNNTVVHDFEFGDCVEPNP